MHGIVLCRILFDIATVSSKKESSLLRDLKNLDDQRPKQSSHSRKTEGIAR